MIKVEWIEKGQKKVEFFEDDRMYMAKQRKKELKRYDNIEATIEENSNNGSNKNSSISIKKNKLNNSTINFKW